MSDAGPRTRPNPFLALRPFHTADAHRFFGRDADLVLVQSRLWSSRTTLLFAASGVGKTSFLNARLRLSLRPRWYDVMHREWASQPPLRALQASIAARVPLPLDGLAPLEQLHHIRHQTESECLLILDQFEEVFQNWRETKLLDDFAMELARIVNDRSIDARVVVSMREEFLGELSLFDNLIPDLFNNSYRLKNPTRAEADEIIRKTAYSVQAVECGPGIEPLLDDLLSASRETHSLMRNAEPSPRSRVPMPFLQIVCHRLWEQQMGKETTDAPNNEKFIDAYITGRAREELGYYCVEKLDALDAEERDLVAAAFGFLLTPGGAKMAYPIDVLAQQAKVDEGALAVALRKLCIEEVRILREILAGRGSKPWFELYHDLYAQFLTTWRQQHEVFRRGQRVDTFDILILPTDDPTRAISFDKAPASVRVVASFGTARVFGSIVLRDQKRWREIIAFHERLKAYTNGEKGKPPSQEEIVRFGGALFETLFQGEVRRLYDQARSGREKLAITLTSTIPWISENAWEFCYDTVRHRFMATDDVHFVRSVATATPADPVLPSRGALRILVVCAQAIGFGGLSSKEESRVVDRAFRSLVEPGLVVTEVLPRAIPTEIHHRLSTGGYNIVHFIGHADFDSTEQGRLIFEDSRGATFALGQRALREIFAQRGVSLLYLHSRQGGATSKARPDFKGVAPALLTAGLPALIAHNYPVFDSSITLFAKFLYRSLALGETLGDAAREARTAVNFSLAGESFEWAIPAIYARDSTLRLATAPTVRLLEADRASQRRVIFRHSIRVGVCDLDGVFPGIEKTLDRLNQVQLRFGFSFVDQSPPLDVWDLETRHVDGTPSLWANRLAERLQGKPVDLGVDLLLCLTRHALRDDNVLYLYSWWPDEYVGHAVAVASLADIHVPAEGANTDRTLANTIVGVLAGFLGRRDHHSGGSRDCPLFFHTDRDTMHLVKIQKFDARCRNHLQKRIPYELPALDSLLTAFA